MTPEEFDKLVQRELKETGEPRPARSTRERKIPPEVQAELDRMLESLNRELNGGKLEGLPRGTGSPKPRQRLAHRSGGTPPCQPPPKERRTG